jgi:hypothetical protein
MLQVRHRSAMQNCNMQIEILRRNIKVEMIQLIGRYKNNIHEEIKS